MSSKTPYANVSASDYSAWNTRMDLLVLVKGAKVYFDALLGEDSAITNLIV